MKVTWFSGTTLRIQIAGRIFVIDPEGAPEGVERAELVSGADRAIGLDEAGIAAFDPAGWRPRRAGRLIDEDKGREPLRLWRVAVRSVLLDALEEAPVVARGPGDRVAWGRWADGAVLILCGTGADCAAAGSAALEGARPRLLALAVSDGEGEAAFSILGPLLGGAGLVMLEAGMAVEA